MKNKNARGPRRRRGHNVNGCESWHSGILIAEPSLEEVAVSGMQRSGVNFLHWATIWQNKKKLMRGVEWNVMGIKRFPSTYQINLSTTKLGDNKL